MMSSVDRARLLVDAPEELAGPIREFFPPEEWDNAAAVSYLESSWRWDALADTTTDLSPCGTTLGARGGVGVTAERSVGYFQINTCNYPDWNPAHFYNVRQNVGTAHALWAARGWSPWYFSAKALGLLP
jgi:hypothetical protein